MAIVVIALAGGGTVAAVCRASISDGEVVVSLICIALFGCCFSVAMAVSIAWAIQIRMLFASCTEQMTARPLPIRRHADCVKEGDGRLCDGRLEENPNVARTDCRY